MKRFYFLLAIGYCLLAASNVYALVDVPDGHWAYEAIQKMIQEGLMEGFPDDTFQGKRPVTRYEMAVLLARAMDKVETKLKDLEKKVLGENKEPDGKFAEIKSLEELKAALDKLSQEFKTELEKVGAEISGVKKEQQSLSQRVSILEKMKLHGEFRVRMNRITTNTLDQNIGMWTQQRTRLTFLTDLSPVAEGEFVIKDIRNWDFPGQSFVNPSGVALAQSGITDMETARVKFNMGKISLQAGQFYHTFGPHGLLFQATPNTGPIDGALLSIVSKNVTAHALYFYGDFERDFDEAGVVPQWATGSTDGSKDELVYARAEIKLQQKGVLGINAMLKGIGENCANTITTYDDEAGSGLGVDMVYQLNKRMNFTAEYAQYTDASINDANDPIFGAGGCVADTSNNTVEDNQTAMAGKVGMKLGQRMWLEGAYSSIDHHWLPGPNIVWSGSGEEDIEPIYNGGFKGFQIKGTMDMAEGKWQAGLLYASSDPFYYSSNFGPTDPGSPTGTYGTASTTGDFNANHTQQLQGRELIWQAWLGINLSPEAKLSLLYQMVEKPSDATSTIATSTEDDTALRTELSLRF